MIREQIDNRKWKAFAAEPESLANIIKTQTQNRTLETQYRYESCRNTPGSSVCLVTPFVDSAELGGQANPAGQQ